MKKIIGLIIVCTIIISGMFIYGKSDKKDLLEDNNGPIIAAVIDGKASTTFPTTNKYTATVECTRNGIKQDVDAKAIWNGTKWVVSFNDISAGNVRCSANFISSTLTNLILTNNKVKEPLTTPGEETNAYTLDDTESLEIYLSSAYQGYYFTYGTGWTANGKYFNLTGPAVTSDTYANSYFSLVGKYLPFNSLDSASSSTPGTMVATTNLNPIVYVMSATSNNFTYKVLSSNKNITEALLASTADDYGTSYYFRGAVKNNYVEFANKCWRIVRITGDGSVKLVLHNDNTSNVANPCSSVNNSDEAAFAHYDGKNYSNYFNSQIEDNAYVGFMYGTAGSNSYESTHANINKSEILISLETWYKNNLLSYESKLADTIWCNDKSTINSGYGTSNSSYRFSSRQYSPSLICPNDNNGGNLSKFTVSDTINGNGDLTYKIGLLTADEVAFAGLITNSYYENLSTYLYENTNDFTWWTMTPYSFDSGAMVSFVGHGYIPSVNVWNSSSGVRPAISLVSGIEVTSGTGTSEDPYIVN